MDPHLSALKELQTLRADNEPLNRSFDQWCWGKLDDLFARALNYRANPVRGRRAELLKKPEYAAVLKKYE